MKYSLILAFTAVFTFSSCNPQQLQQAMDILQSTGGAQFSVADGLKEALRFGVDTSVRKLSAEGGYLHSQYKILLPKEAQNIVNVVKKLPAFSGVEDKIIAKVNAAAEDAAKKASPIFLDAITSITFDDAMRILKGPDNAATQYLNHKTFNPLFGEFKPVVVNSLNKVGALDLYADIINTYNKIPLIEKKNPDLAEHITDKALFGLFQLIAKKEKGIRTDVSQRTTELLRNVFAQQD